MSEHIGIHLQPGDARERCRSGLDVAGQTFRCDLAVDHEGWAHSSARAEALWLEDVKWPPEPGGSES